ncbi:MAG: hypothetical protein KatS3mg113_0392 [Planctomycetaceae bacterium]|nr:MAG: hypothetical protein KatS3mg113_0392 [Planctomycetaceae bacterium]
MVDLKGNRRDLLVWVGWSCLTWLLPPLASRAAERRGVERPKSLIVLWLAGGPSQLETWDPHPGTMIGGPTQAIPTSQPGIVIAADFPQIADRLQHLAVLRSLVSQEGDHERGSYLMKTGYRPDPTVRHPALGSVLVHEKPARELDIPPFISLGNDPFPSRGGYLGDQYDPYRIIQPGERGQNLRPRVSAERQQRRLEGLSLVNRIFREHRQQRVEQTLHEHTLEAALKMMSSPQLRAFSLDEEPVAVRARYGDSDFGRGCLVARRLIETGVRVVEVTLGGFDTHIDNFTGHRLRAPLVDAACAALIDDLRERDLWESTIIWVTGEFGRTPQINPAEGRDHWPHGFACLVGGGGLRGGITLGATDPEGKRREPEHPIRVVDFHATLLAALGVEPSTEKLTPIGRPLKFSEGKILRELWEPQS